MTHAKHTPGPWRVETQTMNGQAINSELFPFQIESEDWVICEVYGDVPQIDAGANARLIAAAPELLDALQGLLADIQDYQRINNLGGENNHWQVIASAAIAKALGEA